MIVNPERINAYARIFGAGKMQALWAEYLEQSAQAWGTMDQADWKYRRARFHNWRSSSLVFGMEDFSGLCTRIEENILQNRFEQLPKQIKESKTCYENSVLQVRQIMQQMEIEHGREKSL